MMGLLSVALLSGCWSEGENFSKGSVSALYSKTNSQTEYNITYNLKKSLKYWYDENNSLAQERILNVNKATLKRTKDENDKYVYDYKAKYQTKADVGKDLISHDFAMFNTESYMYKTVDGKETYKKTIADSNYGKETVNMLPIGFSTAGYIDRAYQYTNSSSKATQYAIEYIMIDNERETPIYPCWTLFSSVDFSISHASGMTYDKGEMIARLFFNKDGLITKQTVKLSFKINGRKINSNDCHGEATFELEIDYRW